MISTVHRSFKKRIAHRHLSITDEQYNKMFGFGNAHMMTAKEWRLKTFELLQIIATEEFNQIYSELLQGHIQYVKVHRPLNNRPLWGNWSRDKYLNKIDFPERNPEDYKREYLGTWESDNEKL